MGWGVYNLYQIIWELLAHNLWKQMSTIYLNVHPIVVRVNFAFNGKGKRLSDIRLRLCIKVTISPIFQPIVLCLPENSHVYVSKVPAIPRGIYPTVELP